MEDYPVFIKQAVDDLKKHYDEQEMPYPEFLGKSLLDLGVDLEQIGTQWTFENSSELRRILDEPVTNSLSLEDKSGVPFTRLNLIKTTKTDGTVTYKLRLLS